MSSAHEEAEEDETRADPYDALFCSILRVYRLLGFVAIEGVTEKTERDSIGCYPICRLVHAEHDDEVGEEDNGDDAHVSEDAATTSRYRLFCDVRCVVVGESVSTLAHYRTEVESPVDNSKLVRSPPPVKPPLFQKTTRLTLRTTQFVQSTTNSCGSFAYVCIYSLLEKRLAAHVVPALRVHRERVTFFLEESATVDRLNSRELRRRDPRQQHTSAAATERSDGERDLERDVVIVDPPPTIGSYCATSSTTFSSYYALEQDHVERLAPPFLVRTILYLTLRDIAAFDATSFRISSVTRMPIVWKLLCARDFKSRARDADAARRLTCGDLAYPDNAKEEYKVRIGLVRRNARAARRRRTSLRWL